MALLDQSVRIRQLQDNIESDGFDQLAHFKLGEEYLRLGRYREAFAKFRRVIELNAENLEAYAKMGEACEKAGVFKEADAALRTGLTVARRFEDAEQIQRFQALIDGLSVKDFRN